MTEEQICRIERASANIIRALGMLAENQTRIAYQQAIEYGEDSFLILAAEMVGER